MTGFFMQRILMCTVFILGLVSSGLAAEPGLKAGSKAPDFKAVNYEGDAVTLSEYLDEGPVVLLFYRGGWCPYCNRQLQEYQGRIEEFDELGAAIIAVSVDQPSNQLKTVAEKKLSFEVISDPQARILKLYNLVYQVPDELVTVYREKYNIDLEAWSGQKNHMIAIPATFVIDADGTIRYAYANEDYKIRPPAEEILKVLESFWNE